MPLPTVTPVMALATGGVGRPPVKQMFLLSPIPASYADRCLDLQSKSAVGRYSDTIDDIEEVMGDADLCG